MRKSTYQPQLTVLALALTAALAAMAPTPAKAVGPSNVSLSGTTTGYYNDTHIGMLSNSGTISGGTTGIYNSGTIGTIGTLSNTGSIGGSIYGINNDGMIGTLSNSGTVSGGSTDISAGINNGGSITELNNNVGGFLSSINNSGSIGGSTYGILNEGTIGTLSNGTIIGGIYNSGTISGGWYGIHNTGMIATLNNSGAISSSYAGVWNDGTISGLSNDSGGTISGELAIYNGGTIGTLRNTGVISGSYAGVYNNGMIDKLGNSGVTSGSVIGIYNGGTITALTNASGGTISGSTISGNNNYNGIWNNGGMIDTLSNSGVISGGNAGINNSGTITALTNAAGSTITGGAVGVYNSGTIDTLSNSGVISGTGSISSNSSDPGIYNTGTIGTLSNSGIISSGTFGIYNNNGTIGALSNTGTISGGVTGILNTSSGTIGTLSNSGLITGSAYALYNDASGNLGPITNAGTIAGNIANLSSQDLIINGGTGSVFGTLTGFGGTIGTVTNTLSNVVFGSGNQLLSDNINVGTHTVTNIATGTLQVNNAISITGNYSQGANATLNIGVADGATATGSISDTGNGRLMVSGSATIAASSTVALTKLNSYAFAQGQRFVVVQAAGTGTNYNAGNLVYTATGFNGTVTGTSVVDGSNLDLLLTLSGGGSPTPSNPTPSAPVTFATTPNSVSSLSGLFNYGGTNANLLNLFNASAALGSTAAANRAGAQLSPSANAANAAQAATAPTQDVINVTAAHVDGLRVAQAQGDSGVSTGERVANPVVWGQAFGGVANQSQRDDVAGYHAAYNGLLLGADTLVNDRLRVGGLFSYANTSVDDSGDNTGSSTHLTSYGLMGYAGYTADAWYLDVSAGAVQHKYNTARAIDFTGFAGDATGQHNGMQYVASVQGGYPIKLAAFMPDTILTPMAGLTYSTLRQDGYTESGGNGAALNVDGTHSTSLKSDLGAKLERSFATGYGDVVPSVQLGWRHEYQNTRLQSVANYAADTTGVTSFTTLGPTPVANTGVLAIGVTLKRTENLILSLRYTVEAASGYTAQTADVRLRYQF